MGNKSRRVKTSENKAKDVETVPVKLSLSVKDRLSLSSLLPRQGDIVSQVLSRDIETKVRFTQVEIKKIGLKPISTGGFTWNPKTEDVDITFTNAEITLLRGQVDTLDKEKKVSPDTLSLCLKIRESRK